MTTQPLPIGQDDETLTAILGTKCPECGHRGGGHRPAIVVGDVTVDACPEAAR